MSHRKFYVVWSGTETGIFDSWEDCKERVQGVAGARYRAYDSQEDAIRAYRGSYEEEAQMLKSIAKHKPRITNYDAIPEIIRDSIAVDGACSKNPGPMEYRGVDVQTGAEIFHIGPLDDGTNNVAEYLALIHALALFHRQGNTHTAIYSDSRTALSWLRNRGHKSKLAPTRRNTKIMEMLQRADAWIQTHDPVNRVLKWDTDKWGEIPADFNRK